jgi:glycosyltransferase involved in cell wall biosynthesis
LRDEADAATLRWCCAAGVEAVIAISRHIASQAERAWPISDEGPAIYTIINPVELPEMVGQAAAANLKDDARRHLAVPNDRVVFGFIGQLREVKGLLGLVEVLSRMVNDQRWHLLVAGRDPNPGAHYEQACRERAARPDLTGRVTFTGFMDDPSQFYRAIDLAIIPSEAEPLGRVPLEAAAYGKPSAAFAVGGLPDTIHHGESGWLVPAGDWQALGGTLSRFLDSPSCIDAHAARDWVESIADPAIYARRLVEIYQCLLRKTTYADRDSQSATCAPC